ncbi:MAG: hypothetical protein DRP15_02200 [Candidatus Aenigmatarchaeota archaeon]|nr:MAG: hypothetical protein DRP15_02200 [Candidatus Aenigmarchaeota archaeon]
MPVRIKYNPKTDEIFVEGSGNVDVGNYIENAHLVKSAMKKMGATTFESYDNFESVHDLADPDYYGIKDKFK